MPYLNIHGKYQIWFETRGDRKKGSGSPIILLHGFTGTHSTWATLSERLGGTRYVISPDLPGHGRSSVPSMLEDMNVDATSDALRVLLTYLDVEKVTVLGYSLGARIALNFAIRYRDSIHCLILESGTPGIEDQMERAKRKAEDEVLSRDIDRYGLEWFVRKWENLPMFATQRSLGPSVIKLVRDERLSSTEKGLSMSLRAMGTGAMPPMWDGLGTLREVPVLLVVGGKDEKFLEIGRTMAALLPRCTLNIVKEAGHATHLEKPDAFGVAVEQFLDTHCIGTDRGAPT